MKHQWKPLLLVSYIFLFIGAIICMNDVLLPSLKDFFHLSYVQASFVQQSFYLVYLIFPIPIAFYISKFGYKIALVTALVICSIGALFFIPSFYFQSYILALVALFVMSIGTALVNVAANPLAALLGDPAGSHIRVNVVQLFSRIGFSVTPFVATRLIYGSNGNIRFHIPYLVIGAGTLVFAVYILFSAIPTLKTERLKGFCLFSIFKESRNYPLLFWGVITMFFHMGAESCTAGFFISYLRDVAGFDADHAATFLSYYYIASSVVCLIGIYLLRFFSPGKLVAVFGMGMILMYLLAVSTKTGWNQLYLIGMGAFISIVYPSVFSMSIDGAGNFTEKGSALLNTAVVGAAVFPPLQGWIADSMGVQLSYLVPCGCFIVVVSYGIFYYRYKRRQAMG